MFGLRRHHSKQKNWPLLAGRGLPHKLCRSVRRFFRVNPAHLGRLCGPNSSPPNFWRLGRLARWAFSASSWIGPAAKFISRHGARQSPGARSRSHAPPWLVFHWSVRDSGVRVLARSAAAETNVGTGLKSEPDMSVRCLSFFF